MQKWSFLLHLNIRMRAPLYSLAMMSMHTAFRRQISPENCGSDDVQHVLFVLDSSGSIGSTSYGRMKKAIAKLTPLFCKKVKFSLMTFSSRLNLEFCFDCFENNIFGRNAAASAIKAASYQAGSTYTGRSCSLCL